MVTVMGQKRSSRRRQKTTPTQRLDIQGLRMVAVLTVFAFHLTGWPKGGFVGVDVFFVISGFLITGNLLRMAEASGNVSFKRFYWNRVRRIMPAATVVLLLTYLASMVVFLPFRVNQVGIDAVWAFLFLSNWHFALAQTDYFKAAAETVSPIQHYWSLSIEEQFYFVWPALIFLIGLVVARKVWSHRHRMQLAGSVMAGVVTLSLGWALYETLTSPSWAYFNTFARVWELGVGALLATAIGVLAKIPARVKPWLSWGGLALIAASLVLITEHSTGFPAPWALLPVLGSGLVIAAGVGGEPANPLLRHPTAVYVGNISYSLYLVHWPVIVILGAVMPRGVYFYLAVVALTFGLSVGSYHFVENPLRYGSWGRFRSASREIRKFGVKPSTPRAGLATLALTVVALTTIALQPPTHHAAPASPPPATAAAVPTLGPLGTELQREIEAALQATQWPQLNPSIEEVVNGSLLSREIYGCAGKSTAVANPQKCVWGQPSTPSVVIVGDSVALGYAESLRKIAVDGKIHLYVQAMGSCDFSSVVIYREAMSPDCAVRNQNAVDFINTVKPDVVIISNRSTGLQIAGSNDNLTPDQWADSLRQIVDKFRPSTRKLVFLSSPPLVKDIKECYSQKSNTPADCLSGIDDSWTQTAAAEQALAPTVGGVWIDSSPWFCDSQKLCPTFVGTTPTRWDSVHMSPAYAGKISPVIAETLHTAGVT